MTTPATPTMQKQIENLLDTLIDAVRSQEAMCACPPSADECDHEHDVRLARAALLDALREREEGYAEMRVALRDVLEKAECPEESALRRCLTVAAIARHALNSPQAPPPGARSREHER